MLVKPYKKSSQITEITREDASLYLKAEAGVLRLTPQSAGIVRVSYDPKGEFDPMQGEHLTDLAGQCEWSWEQEEVCKQESVCQKRTSADEVQMMWNASVRLEMPGLNVFVDRETGSVSFEKGGKLLLAEKAKDSRTLEAFPVYKTVVNENTQVETIQTADGMKQRIRQADKVFDRELYHTRLALTFAEDERLFGLGQAEEGVWNLRHTTQYLHQANLKIAMPILVSDRGYGIFLSTRGPAVFSDAQFGSYLYTEADAYLDYYLIVGGADEIVRGVRSLTGRASLLPEWMYGYIQSQERFETAEEILSVAEWFRRDGIGLDLLVLDWQSWEGDLWGQKTFDARRFPDPAGMMEKLHEQDVRLMISIWPNMSEKCENYREFAEKGMLLPGNPIYDAFDEEARRLYWEQMQRGLYCHGLDAWWADSSEPMTPEWGRMMKPEPGEMYQEYVSACKDAMPLHLANAYGLYHSKGIYEGQRNADGEKRAVLLTRNGYIGSQQYGTILWSGDTSADWETLKKQIAAGLQMCVTGFPYWTLDIGAFFVKDGEPWYWSGSFEAGTDDFGYRELYTRWFQYGAFLPFFRSHGTDCRREPWNFGCEGEPFYEAIREAIRLRYRLLPYIYSEAGKTWLQDGTMMRMLLFDFPEDKRAVETADEFMFGPSLLICPVTEPMYYLPGNVPVEKSCAEQGGSAVGECPFTRTVYLPAGCDWYDFHTGQKYTGGQEIHAKATIDTMPIYVKAGSILPMRKEDTVHSGDKDGVICLQVYPGADGEYLLYEDAGDGYGYESGDYCLTRITCEADSRKVEWHSEGNSSWRRGAFEVVWP